MKISVPSAKRGIHVVCGWNKKETFVEGCPE
jgi:hypothetical protein